MTPPSSTIGSGLRALVATETRIALVLATLLVGAAAAFGLAYFLPVEQRTFAGIAPLTQLVLTVLTAFAAAAITFDLRDDEGEFRSRTAAPLPSRWLAAAVYGVAIGVFGAVVVALATVVSTGSTPLTDRWAGAVPAVIGCLLVQLIPVGVGTAAGLLLPRLGLAGLATVVVPLLLTLIIGNLAPRGTADWVTPLGAAGHLVPGPMSIVNWAQWVVTAALWVVLPNAIGARLLQRRAA